MATSDPGPEAHAREGPATAGKLDTLDLDDLAVKALALEDGPDPAGALEDPDKIAVLVGL